MRREDVVVGVHQRQVLHRFQINLDDDGSVHSWSRRLPTWRSEKREKDDNHVFASPIDRGERERCRAGRFDPMPWREESSSDPGFPEYSQ